MTDNISVREACRRRQAIGGADAQALEGALSMTESERDDARAQLDAEKARADDLSRMVAAMGEHIDDVERILGDHEEEGGVFIPRADLPRRFSRPDVAAERGRWVDAEEHGNLAHAYEDMLAAAERSRDELGIQLAAQSERLRLAMDAVKKLKAFRDSIAFNADGTRLRVINSIDICAMWDESNDAVAALDAVPGDALATSTPHPLDVAHEASGVVTTKVEG